MGLAEKPEKESDDIGTDERRGAMEDIGAELSEDECGQAAGGEIGLLNRYHNGGNPGFYYAR